MMMVISEAVLAVSSSPAGAIVAKTTLVMVVALSSVWVARGSRASVRHTVLAAAFSVLLVLPIASIVAPPVGIPLRGPVAAVALPVAIDTNLRGASEDVPVGAAPVISRAPGFSWSGLLFTGWMAGIVVFLLPTIRGLWQVRTLRRSGLPWQQGQSVLQRLVVDSGVHRRVDVLLHESLAGPMTCGIVSPAIVLPYDARSWDEENLNRAIVHELEHVRRGDWMWHCIARVVCAGYWFHPLVWIARRQLALEAERACDDAVVGRSEATAYADQLVELAQRLSDGRKSPALAMASRSDLSARVRAVLDGRQRRGRAGAILVAGACAVAAVVVATMSPLKMVAEPQAPDLKFEVASIKPIDPAARHMTTPRVYPGGRVVMEAITLKSLVTIAFGLSYWQISGGDVWTANDRYDVEAKPPANLQPGITNLRHSNWGIEDERLREMLQALLTERFHLRFHRETKTGKVYLLERNGNALRLRPTDAESPVAASSPEAGNSGFSGDIGFAGGRWVVFNTSMPQFAKFAADYILHAPVLDQTGLSGSFDYKQPTRLPDSEVDYSDPSGPFLSLVPELGLKFESAKGPIESFVIDQADRPTPN